jgi:hypothetical protein
VSDQPQLLLPEALLKALVRLLRPLVRLLIRSRLSFPAFAESLRTLYVQVAIEEVARQGAVTDSRVSLLTGVHRKEIRRLREQVEELEIPAVVTVTSQILAQWLGQPAYADKAGHPRVLPRVAAAGEASFEALVRSVTTDVRPRAVLDDWIDQGLARLDNHGRVILNSETFLPRPGSEAQLYYFTRNLRDHIAAASDNITAQQPRFLERAAHYDRLPPEVAARLEASGREAATRMLVELNRQALEALAESGEVPAGAPTRRLNLGVYLYVEDEQAGGAGP